MKSYESKGPGFALGGSQEKGFTLYWFEVQVARNLLLGLQHLEVDSISNIDSQTLFHLESSFSGCSEMVLE